MKQKTAISPKITVNSTFHRSRHSFFEVFVVIAHIPLDLLGQHDILKNGQFGAVSGHFKIRNSSSKRRQECLQGKQRRMKQTNFASIHKC